MNTEYTEVLLWRNFAQNNILLSTIEPQYILITNSKFDSRLQSARIT